MKWIITFISWFLHRQRPSHSSCHVIWPAFHDFVMNIQGVPKKTHVLGFLFITPLWKGLGTKVGCVLKNSGNSQSDRHQNISIWPIRSLEIWVQSWQCYIRNSWKKGWNFAVLLQLFPFASIASYNFSFSFAFEGIPPNIQNVDIIVQHKCKHYRVSQENQFYPKEFSPIFSRILR